MRYDDFCILTTAEFEAVCKAWNDRNEAMCRDEWERMRMLATISIQPHIKGKMEPHKLLPFTWDRKKQQSDVPKLTPEELKKRKERVTAILGATF